MPSSRRAPVLRPTVLSLALAAALAASFAAQAQTTVLRWGDVVGGAHPQVQMIDRVAAEVKARRADLGISQEELALRAEVNRTFVGKIELAMNQPTLTVLLRLAEGLQTPLPELIESVLKRKAKENKSLRKKA